MWANIMKLTVCFHNQVLVLAQWRWVYLHNERDAWLITGDAEALLERRMHPQHDISINEAIAPTAS
jgi:hypothetical protein